MVMEVVSPRLVASPPSSPSRVVGVEVDGTALDLADAAESCASLLVESSHVEPSP